MVYLSTRINIWYTIIYWYTIWYTKLVHMYHLVRFGIPMVHVPDLVVILRVLLYES
jgi:hypothetical protein